MKKFILICVINLVTVVSSFSQTVEIADSLTQTPQEQFEHITEHRDLSSISTGLLADKCLPKNRFKQRYLIS